MSMSHSTINGCTAKQQSCQPCTAHVSHSVCNITSNSALCTYICNTHYRQQSCVGTHSLACSVAQRTRAAEVQPRRPPSAFPHTNQELSQAAAHTDPPCSLSAVLHCVTAGNPNQLSTCTQAFHCDSCCQHTNWFHSCTSAGYNTESGDATKGTMQVVPTPFSLAMHARSVKAV